MIKALMTTADCNCILYPLHSHLLVIEGSQVGFSEALIRSHGSGLHYLPCLPCTLFSLTAYCGCVTFSREAFAVRAQGRGFLARPIQSPSKHSQ
jgi:hypothetical protein